MLIIFTTSAFETQIFRLYSFEKYKNSCKMSVKFVLIKIEKQRSIGEINGKLQNRRHVNFMVRKVILSTVHTNF